MVYDYPPSKFAENLTLTIVIHVVLLLAAFLPLFFVWVRTNRQANKSEIWFIATAMVLVPIAMLIVGPSLPPHWIPFLMLYALFFEVVSLVSLVAIARRLKAQGQATSVVGIIGSLFGLGFLILCLLPAVPSAKEAARRMQCSNNLRQLTLALLNDEDRRGSYLPVKTSPEDGPFVSWRVEVLPFLEQQVLFDSYDRTSAWDSNANAALASTNLPYFTCPSNLSPSDEKGRWFTAYVRPDGASVKSAGGGKLDVSRSNTIAVIEACGQNIVWSEPRDSMVDDATLGVNLPGKKLGTSDGTISSYHTGGANFATLDGSVSFISKDIDPNVLRQMLDGL